MKRICLTGESTFLQRHELLAAALAKRGYDVVRVDDERASVRARARHTITASRFALGGAALAAASRAGVDLASLRAAFYRSADAFAVKSRAFEAKIATDGENPDAVLHLLGFSSPFASATSTPYAHYLNDTAALRSSDLGSGGPPANAEAERFLRVERSSYERAACLFTTTAFLADAIATDYGIPRDKVHVVGTGPAIAIASAIPKLLGTRRLLFNASDFERRGGALVMDAFAIAHRADPSIELVTVGAALPSAYATGDGIDDRGRVSVDVMRELFTTCDVLLAPSTSGPLPHVVLEAMAHGTPAIVRDRAGAAELVHDGRDGVVLSDERARPESLAAIVRTLVDDRATLEHLSEGARATVAAHANWDLVAERMEPALSAMFAG